jgi:hypothetical protein
MTPGCGIFLADALHFGPRQPEEDALPAGHEREASRLATDRGKIAHPETCPREMGKRGGLPTRGQMQFQPAIDQSENPTGVVTGVEKALSCSEIEHVAASQHLALEFFLRRRQPALPCEYLFDHTPSVAVRAGKVP